MIKQQLQVVRLERLNLIALRPKIEAISNGFARYLSEWRGRSASRHALMGPVARVLDLTRRGQSDFGEIMGRALRMHEMATPFLSSAGRRNLEDAVRELLEVIEPLPLTARRRLLEQVEYHVYYLRRVELLRRLDEIGRAWREFLEERYRQDVAALQRAWGDRRYTDFSNLPFPSRRRAEEDSPLGRDVKGFLAAREDVARQLDEAEEESGLPEAGDEAAAE